MKMMPALLDTNVNISGIFFPGAPGPEHQHC